VSTDQLDNIEHGLTVRDPWAQAIIYGPKRIENRGKRPPYKIIGERIAVHTANIWDGKETAACHHLADYWDRYMPEIPKSEIIGKMKVRHHPGHIIGTVRVVGYWNPPDDTCEVIAAPESCWWDCINEDKGLIRTDLVESDPWWQGPVGWLLADPQPLDEPVPARGMPQVWNVDKQVEVAR